MKYSDKINIFTWFCILLRTKAPAENAAHAFSADTYQK